MEDDRCLRTGLDLQEAMIYHVYAPGVSPKYELVVEADSDQEAVSEWHNEFDGGVR